jgi:hypothetical protein
VKGMYLYTPQTNPTVICRNSKTRIDQTRLLSVTVENRELALSDRTRRSEMIGRADQR